MLMPLSSAVGQAVSTSSVGGGDTEEWKLRCELSFWTIRTLGGGCSPFAP